MATRVLGMLSVTALLAGTALVGVAPAAHAAVGDATYFDLATGANPYGIAAGPDGNLWITETDANNINRMTTAGVMIRYAIPTLASQPKGITAGPDGNLWFVEYAGNKVAKITPQGVITEYALNTTAAGPQEITVGPDGALWFTMNSVSKIGRITTTGTLSEYSLPTATGPYAIASGPSGSNVLYVTAVTSNQILVIKTDGSVQATNTIPTAASSPKGITYANGAAWFTENLGNKLGRVVTASATSTTYTLSEIALPSSNNYDSSRAPLGIATGPADTVWYVGAGNTSTGGSSGSRIGQMSKDGAIVGEYLLTPAGAISVTQGPDGNMWVTFGSSNKAGKVITGQVPVMTTAPAITPNTGVQAGTALTVDNGAWSPTPSSYSYTWQLCADSGATSCTGIAGATTNTYTPVTTDAGKYVRAAVTPLNSGGAGTAAYSNVVAVASLAPLPGNQARVGNNVVASLTAPSSIKLKKTGTFRVTFTSTTVQGTVTIQVAKGSKLYKIANNAPVSGGVVSATWKVPKKAKTGTWTVTASFTPTPSTAFQAGTMRTDTKVKK
ncbi:MAG: hypothetical protein KGN78_00530 [Actinomycetales bacterium]|nr:hypothetical protein [Actinomycetales bacterium]